MIRGRVLANLERLEGPIELESDVGYPGAPRGRSYEGGDTPRRLLNAIDRDGAFLSLALNSHVIAAIRRLLGRQDVAVSRAHHNCVMTKFPEFSSDTLWHRDIRYWAFQEEELISAWFALGDEDTQNGALSVIPGSHLLNIAEDRFDSEQFLKSQDPQNHALIKTVVDLRLKPGDVLLFHCKLLHSATRNYGSTLKISPVFTYHDVENRPIPSTKSSSRPCLRVRRCQLAS